MSYTRPPIGSKVTVTITGFVDASGRDELHLDSGISIESESSFDDKDVIIEVTVLAPAPEPGQLGFASDPFEGRVVVMFQRANEYADGKWMSGDGTEYKPSEVTPLDPANVAALLTLTQAAEHTPVIPAQPDAPKES